MIVKLAIRGLLLKVLGFSISNEWLRFLTFPLLYALRFESYTVSALITAKEYAPDDLVMTHDDRRLIYTYANYTSEQMVAYEQTAGPLYVAHLRKVQIIGGSNIVLTEDCKAIYDLYFDDIQHRYSYSDPGFGFAPSLDGRVISLLRKKRPHYIKRGIMISANYSFNYYHFTLEILPRFALLSDLDVQIPIIVDNDMFKYPQFEELLGYFNTQKRRIVAVNQGENYVVGDLYYPSIAHRFPPNIALHHTIRASDFLFDPWALDYVRKVLLPRKAPQKFPEKIFLARPNGALRSFNQSELFESLASLGFELIYTDRMSVADQVALFAQARWIIGSTGAAFTNLLYCSRGCNVIAITNVMYTEVSDFSTLAMHVGANLHYMAAEEREEVSVRELHSDFRVNVNKIIALYDDIEATA